MSPAGHFADLNDLPSWVQYDLAGDSVARASKIANDPEDTLMVQLTFSELSTLTLGLLITGRVFPELVGLASDLSKKLKEVATAQEFLNPARTSEDE